MSQIETVSATFYCTECKEYKTQPVDVDRSRSVKLFGMEKVRVKVTCDKCGTETTTDV